jgi:hypothetical protein
VKAAHVLALALALGAAPGCATTIKIDGPGEADVNAAISGNPRDFTFLGRKPAAERFVWKVPSELENQKVVVLVRSDLGAWKYTVFTDRDVVVHYPPKGAAGLGIGAIEAVVPEPAPPPAVVATPAARAPAAPKPPAPKPPPKPGEEPSATITTD